MTRSPSRAAGAFLLLTAAAQAQPAQQSLPPADPRAVFHALTENDSYNVSNPRTDRWYTNGIRLHWQSAENNLPDFMLGLDRALTNLLGPANSRWGLGIGQEIFTPVNKRLSNPDPRDRPYAGYLHANLTLDRRNWTTLDRVEVQAGVVGPSSFGRQAQDSVHDILGDRRPRGWRYELRDEPVFNVNLERIWRLPVARLPGGLGVDALPSVGTQLGTVRVAASVAARLRIGQGLDRDFGVPRIRSALADAPAPVGEGFGWYLFGGVGGNAVAHDIFLDGNTYRNSRSVDVRPLTGEAEAGAAVFWRNVRLSYTQVWRSKDFMTQPKPFAFGAFSLSLAF